MANPDVELKAIIALLCEVEAQGNDMGELVKKAKSGVMGTAPYAPSGAAAKPHVVDMLDKALECAQSYIN